MEKDTELINKAFAYWQAADGFRRRRRRFKSFTYGRQWGDAYLASSGRVISEEQSFMENGRIPITNNLIRQLVKSIVGRYRYLASAPASDDVSIMLQQTDDLSAMQPASTETVRRADNIDARAMEEFLISGCVVQRVELPDGNEPATVCNVSPERMFWSGFRNSDASDCRFIGMLHDLPLSHLIRQFSGGSVEKAMQIKEVYARRNREPQPMEVEARPIDFSTSDVADLCRVVEVWQKVPVEILRCHDLQKADYYVIPFSDDAYSDLCKENLHREEAGEEKIESTIDVIDLWQCCWLTPRGEVLARTMEEEDGVHPFAIMLYPLIDGEVHSLVEDVIDQQKYVNRLITMLDDIVSSSAKGVLLFPTEQLPDGFTWRDIRRIWANPNGIIPYRRTAKGVMPQQINSSGTSVGAAEMLKVQLQLFDEISGASGAIRGKSSSAQGEQMLRTELETGTISLLDIFATFREFINRRNVLISQLSYLNS